MDKIGNPSAILLVEKKLRLAEDHLNMIQAFLSQNEVDWIRTMSNKTRCLWWFQRFLVHHFPRHEKMIHFDERFKHPIDSSWKSQSWNPLILSRSFHDQQKLTKIHGRIFPCRFLFTSCHIKKLMFCLFVFFFLGGGGRWKPLFKHQKKKRPAGGGRSKCHGSKTAPHRTDATGNSFLGNCSVMKCFRVHHKNRKLHENINPKDWQVASPLVM